MIIFIVLIVLLLTIYQIFREITVTSLILSYNGKENQKSVLNIDQISHNVKTRSRRHRAFRD